MIGRIVYIALCGTALGFIMRWLMHYSANIRNANSFPHFRGAFVPSSDTTVSAYARQGREFSRANDEHAARLMKTVQDREYEDVETVTETRTEQAP